MFASIWYIIFNFTKNGSIYTIFVLVFVSFNTKFTQNKNVIWLIECKKFNDDSFNIFVI